MKVYLAGPDVFRPDVDAWAASSRELCRRYGFEPLLPIDHQESGPEKIFKANLELIRKAQIVIANLDPFRGPEPDSGTAFELGYALALSKRVCGYVTHMDTLLQRVARSEGYTCEAVDDGVHCDHAGLRIENFGMACNLMLAVPTHIVEGGLEACLQSLRGRSSTGEW